MSTRRVYLIERASSPAALPCMLAQNEDEAVYWTRDASKALRFTEKHLADRFAHNRVTEAVCVVDRTEAVPAADATSPGWAAANIQLHRRRDDMDAFKARMAAAAAEG